MFGTAYSPAADALIYPELPTLVSLKYYEEDVPNKVTKSYKDLNCNFVDRRVEEFSPDGPVPCFAKVCIPARYIFAVVSSLGFFLMYAMRINLSVAIVAMVNQTAIRAQSQGSSNTYNSTTNETEEVECPNFLINTTTSNHTTQEGEFDWTDSMQGLILGSFYWGYIITQIPGGLIGERFGAKWLFGFGVIWTGAFTLVSPVAATEGGPWALVVIRALQGFGQGVTFPTMNYLISRWAPPHERSRISTVIYAGTLLGTMVGVILSGVLIDNNVGGGWPIVFYLFGALGCGWFLLWIFFAFESPETHPWISPKERHFILKSLNRLKPVKKTVPKFPFCDVISSLPMWSIVIAHMCNNWGLYLFLSDLPLYLKTILKYDMSENSLRSALPFLTCWLFSLICSNLGDFLIVRKWLHPTVVRRIFNSLGQFGPGFLVLGVTFVKCNRDLSYTLLVVALTINGATYAGFNCNHVDLSPVLAGTLFGITNTLATIPGFVGPSVVGALTEGQANEKQWNIIFYITAAVYWFSGLFYATFAQGVEQPWNKQTLHDLGRSSTRRSRHLSSSNNGNGFYIGEENVNSKVIDNYFNISNEAVQHM